MNECTPRRGEVWRVNFSPTVSREQYGDQPALIVSTDRCGQAGLQKTSFALCEMVRSLSKECLRRRSGQVQTSTLEAVEDRLRILLDL